MCCCAATCADVLMEGGKCCERGWVEVWEFKEKELQEESMALCERKDDVLPIVLKVDKRQSGG